MEREISTMRSRMEREFSKMRLFMRRKVLLMRQQIDVLLRRLAFGQMESKKLRMRKKIDNLLKKIELEEDYKRMKINMEKEFSRMKYFMEKKLWNMRKLIGCPLMGSFRSINKMDAEIDDLLRRLAFGQMESKKLRMRKKIDNLLKKIELEEDYKRMKINMEKEFSRMKYFIGCSLMGSFRSINKMDAEVIHDTGSSDDDASDGDKQQINKNYKPYHGSKLLKSTLSLSSFFLPCVGGTGNGSGQREDQDYSEIYQSTLGIVSNCPSPREYLKKSLEKCADVCGSYMQDGNCTYHCMRHSSKTRLVEFCAKPKILFEYCPEYDPVDQTIQKDLTTLCNSKISRNYYNSSDIYHCDPDNCLQLSESSVHTGATTLTMLMNETTEISSRDSQEWLLPLLVAVVALIILGVILCLVFKRRIFSACKMEKKRNRNGIHHENDKSLIDV